MQKNVGTIDRGIRALVGIALLAVFFLGALGGTPGIVALVVGIALPNLGMRSRRVMEDEAKQLAASLEFARQRSVMTGVPHRVVIDVEEGGYWLEWLVSEARSLGEEELAVLPVYEAGDREQIPMAPPRAAERAYRALPGSLGLSAYVPEIVRIDGETGHIRIETLPGEVFLWRIVQHVLPRGFHRIRDYGFLHHNARKTLQLIQLILQVALKPLAPEERPRFCCCACGGAMEIIGVYPPQRAVAVSTSAQGPPQALAA